MCIAEEEADDNNDHIKPDEQEHDKSKYKGEELVETNRATEKVDPNQSL